MSKASCSPDYKEKKRTLNLHILQGLSSGMSQNRLALTLNCSRSTIVRKFLKLSHLAKAYNEAQLSKQHPTLPRIYFDEMRSSIHTKHKPVSIPLSTAKTRHILALSVAPIPDYTPHAPLFVKKYGKRPDKRQDSLLLMLHKILPRVSQNSLFISDDASDYPNLLKKAFPFPPIHHSHKGRRGSGSGYGELKVGGWDPLFPLNHSAAMLRANVNRLFRKTWNTSKKEERLELHMQLYAFIHNNVLVPIKEKKIKKHLAFKNAYDALLLFGSQQIEHSLLNLKSAA